MTASSRHVQRPLPQLWQLPDGLPSLPLHALHIWRLLKDARLPVDQCQSLLQPEERERAACFHFREDRHQWVAARAALRLLLAHYADCARAQDISLTLHAQGKPELPGSGIRFNLSHTRDVAVFAFARNIEVGIDVEQVRAMEDLDEVAQQNFAPAEIVALQRLPQAERTHAFYRCWTRKEALLKAEGSGLYRALSSFTVSFSAGEPAHVLEDAFADRHPSGWSLAQLNGLPGATGAVAWSNAHPQPEIALFDWQATLFAATQ